VSTTTLSDLTPLPLALHGLLEAFCRTHDACVRLWGEEDGRTVCLYPADETGTEPWPDAQREPVAAEEGPLLQLELRAGRSGNGDAALLARALADMVAYEREARSAARELTERYEEINLLYFIAEILASVISVPDAATRILTEVADVLGARRASLWVYRPEDASLHLAAAVGEDGMTGPIAASDTESATAWVFREKQALNLERGRVLSAVPRLEPRPQAREAFVSVPINYTPPDGAARTVGVITLVGRRSNVRFNAGDVRLLSAIASQVGAALETQRLVQESLRQERMVRELELAHDLQLKLLPDSSSFEPPPEMAGRCVPAESVGGDFYQLFRLSNDRLGLMIGDVSSHGFSAALIMALTMSAVGIYAQESGPPGEVLRRVRRALIKELETTEMYLTLFYGVLDPAAGQITYSNAGHPHAFRINTRGEAERLGATDPPLGMVATEKFGEATARWNGTGDLVCLFTDGLSDAYRSRSGTGETALIQDVVKRRTQPLTDVLDHLFRVTSQTSMGVPPDDRTALLVRG
jgi:phosphoserine phosphatase RsbU/P